MRALILAETPSGCAERLRRRGFSGDVADEIAAYLSQATDLETERSTLLDALGEGGIDARLADAGDPRAWLGWLAEEPERTVVWPVTDGFRYYGGSAVASAARLYGARSFGCGVQAYSLAQDKAKAGLVAAALGVAVPPFGLARNGTWLVPPSIAEGPWFVKPNTLGAKIGIWRDSLVDDLGDALDLSRRIHDRYRDDAVVQAFVPGHDVRVSYMAVEDDRDLHRLGVYRMETGGGGEAGGAFITMSDNLTLSGLADTSGGATASKAAPAAFRPTLVDVAADEPEVRRRIVEMMRRLADGFDLRDLFSVDIRVGGDGTLWVLEFEVCPAVTIYDFRRYLDDYWGCDLPAAVTRAFHRVLDRPEVL